VLTVRADRDVESLAGAVRNSITEVDREIPVFSVQTMNDRMDSALVPRRVPMLIGLVFGIVALFLAASGSMACSRTRSRSGVGRSASAWR
jgi:hypothetical protein